MKNNGLNSPIKRLLYANYHALKAYRMAKLYYANFLQYLNSRNRETVIVYQMGKVGSTTIYDSLQPLKNLDVYHIHSLTKERIEVVEKNYKSSFRYKHSIPAHILESQYLRKKLEKGLKGKKKWKVVTRVRDPIARNISSFFQILEEYVGHNYQAKIESMKVEDIIEELMELFLYKYKGEKPLNWFDIELKAVFDIDIYSREFSKSKGYEIYEAEFADALLIKLENLNECAGDAFKNFLGVSNFALINSNISSSKSYSDIYRQFLNSILLPESYINKMYTSKYMRHFYSQEEIEALKAKWCRQNHTANVTKSLESSAG